MNYSMAVYLFVYFFMNVTAEDLCLTDLTLDTDILK
jgi:hypothetical protein